jgi:DNA invertase Pin-like site-specific DNA recombinase
MLSGTPRNTSLVAAGPIRAAQYVRMSTEHQKYSVLNQVAVIQHYAALRGMEVVRTYADEGKSGLRIENRDALKELIRDVVTGDADYNIILVYDVSRWGRFQDTDESAHYEFICRQSGINIEYCAEPFSNDGTAISAVVKSIKRAMAAEYSRELSVKVFTGQKRVAEMGYRIGGHAGFGLRRMLVDEHGTPRGILELGQRKLVKTDRILLVPGPPEEVKTVRWIFQSVAAGTTMCSVARSLNKKGIKTSTGHSWANPVLSKMIKNEAYLGHNIWNQKSAKLRGPTVRNPVEEWIRVEGAFQPIVTQALFDRAQRAITKRIEPRPDEELLDGLRAVLAEKGRLNHKLIAADKRCAAPSIYERRFGGLLDAYRLIGYKPKRDYRDLRSDLARRRLCVSLASQAASRLRHSALDVRITTSKRSIIVDDDLSILFMALVRRQTKAGQPFWEYRPAANASSTIVVAARLQDNDCDVHDFYIFPRTSMKKTVARIGQSEDAHLDIYCCATLEPLDALFKQRDADGVPLGDRIVSAIQQTRS